MCKHENKVLRDKDDEVWGGLLFWHCPDCGILPYAPVTDEDIAAAAEMPPLTEEEYAQAVQATFAASWGIEQKRGIYD